MVKESIQGLTPLGKSRPGAVVMGVNSAPVMQANARRTYALLVNNSTNVIYLWKGDGPALLNAGIPLAASGGWYEINLTNPYYGPIQGIATGAASNLCIQEEELY